MPAFIRTSQGNYINIDHIVRVSSDFGGTRLFLSDETSPLTKEPLEAVMRHITAVGGRLHQPGPETAS